ncbi:hypothetical protein [uncultured Olleya sp.]|uniref:hypothetical protein n=1 Tax=uncultured Olleya sp. TaxID=757243 RepID=UPI0025984F52|nr:hypothetical protein [uncultured Olleya sp.]
MSRISKIGASIITLISGWLMIGIGYTTKMGHPISTVLFLSGIVFCIIGFIWFIISITSKKNKI